MRIPATCLIVAILAALPAPALPADAGLRRLPIPVDAIRAEDGRCFIATLDFGDTVEFTRSDDSLEVLGLGRRQH